MHIDTSVSLTKYIRNLLECGCIERFYKSQEWLELRDEVLREFHYECQECLKRGIYKRADVVHHVNHVKIRPDLALSKYYVDHEGNEHRQLVPLCDACHSVAHPEKGFVKGKERFTNKERW